MKLKLPHLSNPHKLKKKGNHGSGNIIRSKIYVGTYGKYNAGSILGKWFDLTDYSDKNEFNEACRKLHKDEKDVVYIYIRTEKTFPTA